MSKVGIIEFDKLEIGQDLMKNNTYLREWRCPLPKLTNGVGMFSCCENLTSFLIDLPKLTNGDSMFNLCFALVAFSSDLSNLTNGECMFWQCSELTTFTSDMPNLTDGYEMFKYCENLESFTSDLGSLKSGYHMFRGCKLDAESLSYIANNINDLVEKGYEKDNDEDWKYEVLGVTKTIEKEYRGRIDIGHDESIPSDVIIECGNKLIDKGWIVYFNNTLYEYTNVASPYDVSEANGWCPNAYISEEDNWNTKIYEGHSLIITKITSNGEMLNDE